MPPSTLPTPLRRADSQRLSRAIDAAVALARSSLYAPTGRLQLSARAVAQRRRGLIFTTASDPGTPVRRGKRAINAERRWLVQVAQDVDTSRLPPDLRFVARDWERTLSDLHGLLDQLRYVQLHGSAGAYQDKARQYQTRKAALLRLQSYIDELPK